LVFPLSDRRGTPIGSLCRPAGGFFAIHGIPDSISESELAVSVLRCATEVLGGAGVEITDD